MNPMIFNFFLMNCPSHIFHGSWRHPESRSLELTSLELWTDLARLAEKGGMDGIFIADNFGMYEEPNDRIDRVIANGIQFPCNDPTVLISAMAAVTKHLAFIYTSSTLQAHPSPFARAAATLDHATKGRIGWNVVTSFVRNAARSVGVEESWSHDERYRWAEEYIDVTYKLWEGSWVSIGVQTGPPIGAQKGPPFQDGSRLIGHAPLRCARRREGGARPEARAAQSIL